MIDHPALAVALWYLASGLLGWLSLPLVHRIFGRLPDSGFGLTRPFGLLAAGYLLWLGANTGLVHNTWAGIVGVILLLGLASWWAQRGRWAELRGWLSQKRGTILIMELLFALAFVGWAFVRSHDPAIVGTEKPMELAFLNAVLASETFPPLDPWLSGFAISYYYYGYVLAGMLTKLTAVAAGVAFNLTISLWFAMTAVAAYSLVYNLIAVRDGIARLAAPLLGPLMVAIMGNLEGFLEMLHTRHLFWVTGPEGTLTSGFWRWLNLEVLSDPPLGPAAWIPSRHWWWWQASRVVRDINVAGADSEVIDEFPFFSFFLADIHPHVLALPFVLVALSWILNLYLDQQSSPSATFSGPWRVAPVRQQRGLLLVAGLLLLGGLGWQLAAAGVPIAQLAPDWWARALLLTGLLLGIGLFLFGAASGRIVWRLAPGQLVFSAWLFGALAFANAWDFPIYVSVLFFVLVIAGGREWRQALLQSGATSLLVVLGAVGMYLWWYPSFSSQLGGVLPNLAFPTAWQAFAVMFLPLLAPLWVWLVRQARPTWSWRLLAAIGLGLPLALLAASWLLAGLAAASQPSPVLQAAVDQIGVAGTRQAVSAALSRRLAQPWTALIMGVTVALVWLALRRPDQEEGINGRSMVDTFVLILAGTGALLVLGPEFLYLRDLFGTRMNTVFKFYYAAWIMWGLAAAYAAYAIWPRRWNGRALLTLLAFVPVMLGLFYPVMTLISRTSGARAGRTLDGTAHLAQSRPAEAEAIDWIRRNLRQGVVAEAVGGSYSIYGRVATHTQLATVLGWPWHEVQWRGTVEPQGSREFDIERLYRTGDWREAQMIVEQYEIDFVFVGPLEREAYGQFRETKFEAFMQLVFRNAEVSIYAAPDWAAGS